MLSSKVARVFSSRTYPRLDSEYLTVVKILRSQSVTNHYFVTGVTGAIGSALLPLLLADPHSQIWTLIRADSGQHLTKRLEELITFWDLDPRQTKDAHLRIIPLQGDTDQYRFALSDRVYSEITRKCTHIIHCAGVVRMNLPLETARRHALSASENIVEMARACQASGMLQKVEFVSTVGVAGKIPGLIPETWITEPRAFHNTYEQSKAEAEDYLREQIERHQLPVTIHRPSMVVGDSKTGKIIHHQIFYHICEFLAGLRTFGLIPNLGHTKLDTIPVDYVAAVLKWSTQNQDSIGKIFHLCSGPKHSIELRELQKIVRQIFRLEGLKLPFIINLPKGVFNVVLNLVKPFLSSKVQRTIKTFPFFLDYLIDDQGFDNSLTCQYYCRTPPVCRDYLTILIHDYCKLPRKAHSRDK